MPFTFIFFGIVFLVLIFDNSIFHSNKIRLKMILISLFVMISYFYGDLTYCVFSINVFSLIAVTLLFCIFCVMELKILDIIYLFFVSYFFYILVDSNSDFLISYNSYFVFCFIVLSSLLYLFSIKKILTYSLIESSICCVISGLVEIDNFGFSKINFNLSFDIICFLTLVYFVVLFGFRVLNNQRRCFYVKKNLDNFDMLCSNFYNISR